MVDREHRIVEILNERFLHEGERLGATAAIELRERCASAPDATGVIDAFVAAALPRRRVHDVINRELYAVGATKSVGPEHISDPGPDPSWLERAERTTMDVQPLGIPEDYVGVPPEDGAVPPAVRWSAADKAAALDEMISRVGLEPGQYVDIEWPPEANLWSTGHVYQTPWEPCTAHEDEPDAGATDNCGECEASVRTVVEEPAEWRFSTAATVYRLSFGDDGEIEWIEDYSETHVDIRSLTQDPRYVVIGPAGRGERW